MNAFRHFIICLTVALWPTGVPLAAPLADVVPVKAWQCRGAPSTPGRRSQVATLYFLDAAIEVDRFSPQTGLDAVGGINAVVEVIDQDGAVDEYTFGVFSVDYRAYAIVMQFSARMAPDGPKLVTFPQPAVVTIIDRITGEMRAEGAEPGSSPLSCAAVVGNFEAVARAYDRLMADAVQGYGRQ